MHDNIQEARASVEIAQEQAYEAKAFLEFFIQNPQYACDANRALLKEFHHGETVTLQSLRESVEYLQNQLAVKNDSRIERDNSDERVRLLGEYHALLIDRGGSASAIQSEFEKAKYFSADQISKKIEILKHHQALRALPVEQVRKIANHRPAPEQAELPVEYTRKVILKMPPVELKSLLRRFGSVAVNRRLANQN